MVGPRDLGTLDRQEHAASNATHVFCTLPQGPNWAASGTAVLILKH